VKPKLSIITVNLNNAKGLLKTIESVISQSNKDFEFIVIDGASSDGSAEIVNQYKSHFQYSVSEKDSGIYNAMNKGIRNSNGEYLLFLNSGDWLNNENVVKNVLPLLNSFDVISGDIDIFDKNEWCHIKSEDKLTIGYFLRISLYHQATFISRKLFKEYGYYNEEFKSTGDYEFFLRTLVKNRSSYKHIDLLISNFLTDGMSNDPKFISINAKEREKSWQMSFSKLVLKEIEAFHQLKNSKEIKWGSRIINRLSFLKKQ
jgi:glycosyltransferase involved in cell wall biosynthesis